MTNSNSYAQDRALVKKNYNKIAHSYSTWATQFPSSRLTYLNHILPHLPPDSTLLELGTGAGHPILQTLISAPQISKIYANDISSAQLRLAQQRCSSSRKVKFVESDMLELEFERGSLDGVVGFFSIFHLPREEQREMLGKVAGWLKSGTGVLVMNFATEDAEEIRSGDFFGEEMFWSSFSIQRNLEVLGEVGLEVVRSEVMRDEELKEGEQDYELEFLWVVARKRADD